MARDYEDGDVIFDTQWRALKEALKGNGIVTGNALTPGGGLSIVIAAGSVYRAAVAVTVAGNSVTFTAADPTYSKWGAIWIDAAGVAYKGEGVPADEPLMPEPASWDDVLVGTVQITPGMTVISASDIIDMGFKINTSFPPGTAIQIASEQLAVQFTQRNSGVINFVGFSSSPSGTLNQCTDNTTRIYNVPSALVKAGWKLGMSIRCQALFANGVDPGNGEVQLHKSNSATDLVSAALNVMPGAIGFYELITSPIVTTNLPANGDYVTAYIVQNQGASYTVNLSSIELVWYMIKI